MVTVKEEKVMFKIGEFSQLAKTTVKTLRYYDEISLFKPSLVETNGYRYYSADDLAQLTFILKLRSYGVPIEDVKKILQGENVLHILDNLKKNMEKNVAEMQSNLSLINKLIAKSEKGEIMNSYQAKEIMLPKCAAYYRHGVIKTMGDIAEFIIQANKEVRENNADLKCLSPEYCFVTYEAAEYQAENVELEYTEAVQKIGKDSQNITFTTLQPQKAISVMHKGSYRDLGDAYAFLVGYVMEHNLTLNGKIRERYVKGYWDGSIEENYLTELQAPIK